MSSLDKEYRSRHRNRSNISDKSISEDENNEDKHYKKRKSHKKEKKKRRKHQRSRSPLSRKKSREVSKDTDNERGSTPEITEDDLESYKDEKFKNEAVLVIDVDGMEEGELESPTTSVPVESLSIEESNKVRAKLGLAPLKMTSEPKSSHHVENKEFSMYELIPSSSNQERHRPPENLGLKSKEESLRVKIAERKEKRRREGKIEGLQTLGQSDGEEESAKNWVNKQRRKLLEEKLIAEKRAKILQEMDEDSIKNPSFNSSKEKYGEKDLKGLKILHSAHEFSEGKEIILTLADADVLMNEDDALVNVNIIDEEKNKKNLENIKKGKTLSGYNPYDNEEVDEMTGELGSKNILDKYDEEIEGVKQKSFIIGKNGLYNQEKEIEKQKNVIRQRLKAKNIFSLEMPDKKIASDYYTEKEIVSFKKPKKPRKKVKVKALKADDLLLGANESNLTHFGSRQRLEDDVGDIQDFSKVKITSETEENDKAFQLKQRIRERLSRKKIDIADKLLQENLEKSVEEMNDADSSGAQFIGTFAEDENSSKHIILNETSEFCRNLGAWQSNSLYEQQQNEIFDEKEETLKNKSHKKILDEDRRGKWSTLENSSDDEIMEIEPEVKQSTTILDEEPNLHRGVGDAIKMAMNKGYWDMEKKTETRNNLQHLESKNYLIDDKGGNHDEKGRRQDRYGGPTVPFLEKKDYVPNVKLEYIDDNGRKLNSKEAFRHLSHKFHGKGSGKLKSEKRMKKVMEESLMRNMSSTDTPLGTVEKMKKKQKDSSTPYIVITGKNSIADLRK